MIKCINIDWFQYQVICARLALSNIGDRIEDYEVYDTKVVFPNYRRAFEVRDRRNRTLFYYGVGSSVPGADEHSCSVKVENALLYAGEWNKLLHDFLKKAGATIKNITRLDICCDINLFANELHPSELIRCYLYGGLYNPIRKGSNQFSIIGNKSLDSIELQTIRFGSATSAVKVYMYNKTKELEEVKDKPYIRECWERAGLDCSDVWRIEISVTSAGTFLKRKQENVKDDFFHNEIITLDNYRFLRLRGDMLRTEYEIRNIFITYQREYFRFVDNQGQKFTKDMREIHLFDFSDDVILYKPCSMKSYIKVGRTEKVVANKLFEVCETYNDLTTDERKILYDAARIFERLGAIKNSTSRQLEDMFLSELRTSQTSLDTWYRIKAQFGYNIRDLKLLINILNSIKQ